ncbi:MAG: DUF1080 domain-containing protein [Bacteroidales bacterium]|nr:DUF1080 domain-containing protein [Bacteroidales bacterium]MDT8430439.1 DUF1080 domain-containing protein [Bacteroidales bacterium]
MKKCLIVLAAIALTACGNNVETPTPTQGNVSPDYYLGAWALDLDYENSPAGWLEVRQEEGYLDADLLWRGGSVSPVEFVFMAEGNLMVTRGRDLVRERNANDEPVRTHHAISTLKIEKTNDNEITGTAIFPRNNVIDYEKVTFTGKRLPEPGEKPDLSSISYGDPVTLIAENSLAGWELLEEGAANGWSDTEGILKNDPVQKEGESHIHYGNLRTKATFSDFNLSLEVNVPEGSNSGVYLRGIYEIQVADTYGKPLNSHNMGALYSRITPSVAAEKPAGEWQSLDITLYKRHVTVVLNGIPIINNQPVRGVTGGAMRADEFKPGPIYLQGDHGKVAYRNMVLTPIE